MSETTEEDRRDPRQEITYITRPSTIGDTFTYDQRNLVPKTFTPNTRRRSSVQQSLSTTVFFSLTFTLKSLETRKTVLLKQKR